MILVKVSAAVGAVLLLAGAALRSCTCSVYTHTAPTFSDR
jgi:hypothetical protein